MEQLFDNVGHQAVTTHSKVVSALREQLNGLYTLFISAAPVTG
jgi:hypothetical protein